MRKAVCQGVGSDYFIVKQSVFFLAVLLARDIVVLSVNEGLDGCGEVRSFRVPYLQAQRASGGGGFCRGMDVFVCFERAFGV